MNTAIQMTIPELQDRLHELEEQRKQKVYEKETLQRQYDELLYDAAIGSREFTEEDQGEFRRRIEQVEGIEGDLKRQAGMIERKIADARQADLKEQIKAASRDVNDCIVSGEEFLRAAEEHWQRLQKSLDAIEDCEKRFKDTAGTLRQLQGRLTGQAGGSIPAGQEFPVVMPDFRIWRDGLKGSGHFLSPKDLAR